MLNVLKKIDSILTTCEGWIMVVTGIAVNVLIFSAAVMRYVFHSDFFGYEELTLFCAFWLYFMGSAMAGKKDTHINANMIGMFVKNQKVVAICDFLKCLVSLVVCAVGTYWCFNYFMFSVTMGAKSNVFKLPNAIAQFPMFISFFIWTCYLIRDIVVSVKKMKNLGKEEV